jgi:hypothetical protein
MSDKIWALLQSNLYIPQELYQPARGALLEIEAELTTLRATVAERDSRIAMLEAALHTIGVAVEDVRSHVLSWTMLIRCLVNSLPDDTSDPESSNKSYAEHELYVIQRDLPALIKAYDDVAISLRAGADAAEVKSDV